MNWGPQKTMYFFMESIMCDSCCENITGQLRQVVGITAEATPFDQEKRKGGCLKVSTTNLTLTADQLIELLKAIPVNNTEFHRALEVNENTYNDLIATNKRRQKMGMK